MLDDGGRTREECDQYVDSLHSREMRIKELFSRLQETIVFRRCHVPCDDHCAAPIVKTWQNITLIYWRASCRPVHQLMLFIVYPVDAAKRSQLPLSRAIAIAFQFMYDNFQSKDSLVLYSTLHDHMCVRMYIDHLYR